MQKNKLFMILVVICLLVCVLCTGLVACNKDKETGKEEGNKDNVDDDYTVVETELDTQEVKDAVAPIVRIICDFSDTTEDRPYIGDVMYQEFYYSNDEQWEYFVRQMEKAGISIEQIRTISQKAAPVIGGLFGIVDKVINISENETRTFAEILKSEIDDELISSVKDVFSYMGDNLHAQQIEKIQNLFSYMMSGEPADELSYSSQSSPYINYPISEIEGLFASSQYKDVYDKYYGCDLSFYTIYDSYAELLLSEDAMYLMNGIIKAVFDLGGLTNAEIKTVADFIVDFVSGEGMYEGQYARSLMYVITNYSAADIKTVFNVAAKLINDNTDNEKLNQAFENVANSMQKLQGAEIYGGYFGLAGALPVVADMLSEVTEEQITALQNAAIEAQYGSDTHDVSMGRLLATLIETVKPYYNELGEIEKSNVKYLIGLFDTDLDKLMALQVKPVSQMTEGEFEQFYADYKDKCILNFMDKVSQGYITQSYGETLFLQKGMDETSAITRFKIFFKNYNFISYSGLDTSTTGAKVLTVQATNKNAENTDVYTVKFVYIVYDDAYLANIYPYGYNDLIYRIDVKKDSVVDQNQLVEIADNQIYNLRLYDSAYSEFLGKGEYYAVSKLDEDFYIKEVSMPDTSKTGLQAGVITVVDNFFGEKKIPCVFNVYDEVIKYNERVQSDSNYVLQGEMPKIYYHYGTVEESYINELVPENEISGYDPDKLGVQVVTVNHAGKTYKLVVAVVSKQQVADSVELELYSSPWHHYYNSGDTLDDLGMNVGVGTIIGWENFSTYGELKEYVESLGLTAEFSINTELFNEYQYVELSIKNADGEIISTTGFEYYIEYYY